MKKSNNQFNNPITQGELDFLKENHSNHSFKELTQKLNEKFGNGRNQKYIEKICIEKLGLRKKPKGKSFKPLTQEELNFIKENCSKLCTNDLTRALNNKFHNDRSISSIVNNCRKYGWKIKQENDYFYNLEEDVWLLANSLLMDRVELTQKFNEKFNKNKSCDCIKTRCNRILKVGANVEKGRKRASGNRAYPIGTEIIDRDGAIRLKVSDEYQGSKNWRYKHHWVWEQQNGKIPKGHIIIFADGNPQNCDINNLILIESRLQVMLNKYGFYGYGREVTLASIEVLKTQLELKKM